MLARFLIVVSLLSMAMTACAPVEVDPNSVVKDELGPILKTVVSGSDADRLALLQFANVPCANVEGLGGPPPCPEGVAEGTEVEVFPVLGSEGSLLNLEEMTNMMLDLQINSLYAVYRETSNPNAEPYYQTGEYAMLFERSMDNMQMPVVFQVRGGRIVRIDYRIGMSPDDILKDIPAEQILVDPAEAEAWAKTLR